MTLSEPRKALVIVLLFILAACSSKNDPVGSTEASQETGQTEATNSRRALAIRASSGSKALDAAAQRKNQAMVFLTQGDLDMAERLLTESLKLYENAFDGDDIYIEELKIDIKNQIIREYMGAYRYLCIIYTETGRNDEAEESLNEGKLALAEKFHANDQTISVFIKSIENFKKQKAERTYVKRQVESQHNNHHVKSQFELASQNRILGNKHFFNKEYDKAEHYFQLVLNYCETNSDRAPGLCCKAMNDMGALKLGIVQADDGFAYFESALSLAEKHFPPDHIIIADTLVNIGHYYSSIVDYRKALAPYERALQTFEKSYGPNHPAVLQVYFALGRMYLFEDQLDEASNYTEKAMAGIEGTIGTDNEIYANCLFNMGFLHYGNKEYDQVERSFTQAINIWDKAPGPTSYQQAIAYTLLTRLYAEKGNFDKAVDSLLKCHQIESVSINQVFDFTSQSQQLYRAEGDIITLQKYLHFIVKHFREDQAKVQEAFNTWVTGKGRILDVQARLHESKLMGDNPESDRLFQELARIRSSLSNLFFSQPGTVDGIAYEREREMLEREKDRLEAQLSRISKPFASKRKMEMADVEQVAKTLPGEAVLLEFARTQAMRINPEVKSVDSYIAFVLHANADDEIEMVDLGDADRIDDLITKYKKGISASDKGDGKAAIATSRQLYDLVFHPLVKYLGKSKDVFISPDGNLSLIPFEVLQKPDGSFLIEEFTFNYLSASRDLVGFTENQVAEGKCLLMGAPDFNLASLNRSNGGTTPNRRYADLSELSFASLPHTKTELDDIRKVMGGGQVELYSGKDALEETLLNTDHPAIIHLATHGFFLSDQELPGEGRGFQMAELSNIEKQSNSRIMADIENPLLRSGILLAGAKRSWVNGSNDQYDGFATAEEILGMNLHGTEMVVLSACDTGLGDVKSGEGVFGLRRAFTQAGAKSLVMSLWKVPDKETKELMVRFYRNIKSGKMNRCQALRQAILKEKEIVRKRYGHDNPRYWGAFVFMGQS